MSLTYNDCHLLSRITYHAKMSDSEIVVIESADVNGNPNSSNVSNGEPQSNSSPGPSTSNSMGHSTSNSMGPSTSKVMGPPRSPRTYPCQESGCLKQYSRCQDLLGHYNSKHRDVKIPILVYQWKQEQDAKPKVKCPYCFKFFSQNINRWYYLFYVDMFWEYIFIICCQPNLKLTKSIGYLKSGLRHFETLTGDTICICVQFCNL